MSLVELQKGLTNLQPSNDECGVDYENYRFTQNETEVVVSFPLPEGTAGKMLDVKIGTSTLSCAIKGASGRVLLQGTLFKPIKAEASMWTVEERRLLVVTLCKTNMQYEEWWPHVVTSEPQMDIQTLVPPSKHIRDLDQGAQATVAKMMYDQRQQREGKPTSDEQGMEKMMQQAMLQKQYQQGGGNGGIPEGAVYKTMPPGWTPPGLPAGWKPPQ